MCRLLWESQWPLRVDRTVRSLQSTFTHILEHSLVLDLLGYGFPSPLDCRHNEAKIIMPPWYLGRVPGTCSCSLNMEATSQLFPWPCRLCFQPISDCRIRFVPRLLPEVQSPRHLKKNLWGHQEGQFSSDFLTPFSYFLYFPSGISASSFLFAEQFSSATAPTFCLTHSNPSLPCSEKTKGLPLAKHRFLL